MQCMKGARGAVVRENLMAALELTEELLSRPLKPKLVRQGGLAYFVQLAAPSPAASSAAIAKAALSNEHQQASIAPSTARSSSSSLSLPCSLPPPCPGPGLPDTCIALPDQQAWCRLKLPLNRQPSPAPARAPKPDSTCPRQVDLGEQSFDIAAAMDPADPPPSAAPLATTMASSSAATSTSMPQQAGKKKRRHRKQDLAHSAPEDLDLQAAWVQSTARYKQPRHFQCQFCGVHIPASDTGHPEKLKNRHENTCARNPDRGYPCSFCDAEFATEHHRDMHEPQCPRKKR